MKNRKFIGKNLEVTAWDVETYTSRIFEEKPMFWAEFTYTDGTNTVRFELPEAKKVVEELTKFINYASKKEAEFNDKNKKKVKK